MIKEFIKLENKNIPIISIIIYCLPFIWGTILTGGNVFSDKELSILHRPKRKMRQNSLFFLIM